jgi:hypothetical protein
MESGVVRTVKQRITPEQYQELNEEQQDRLKDLYPYEWKFCPTPSIGELIEMLQATEDKRFWNKEKGGYSHDFKLEQWKTSENWSFSFRQDLGRYVKHSFSEKELCDVLWDAFKVVLSYNLVPTESAQAKPEAEVQKDSPTFYNNSRWTD